MNGYMLEDYYALAKPGLVFGNLITVIAGFLVGSAAYGSIVNPNGESNLAAYAFTILGIALVMASGCVFNNVIDRDIDAKMERTKERSIVVGRVSRRVAVVYGTVLGIAGFAVLVFSTNWLTVAAAAVGWLAYVVLYSMWGKRRTEYGVFVGSLAGAVPPVVGYTAAAAHFDLGAILLFATLVIWQMPHFYSIAIRRYDDYAAARVPVLPVRKGIAKTKWTMFAYIAAFILVAPSFQIFGYAGPLYVDVAMVLGFGWLGLCVAGLRAGGAVTEKQVGDQLAIDKQWARRMFLLSLVVMVLTFTGLGVDALLRI